MHIWLNKELDTLEDYFGTVARNDLNRNSEHYVDFHWWQRGKEERKLKQKMDNGLEDEVTLYRYTTITQLWQMITSKKFTLLNPSLWKDPLESPFFNARIQRNGNETESPFKDRFFAQCFTLNDSSESMWKTYGRGEKLVRLKIKVGQIKKLIEYNTDHFDTDSFYLGRVVYLNFEDIKYLFEQVYRFEKTFEFIDLIAQARTLLVKRYSYCFEKEVRLIYDALESFKNKRQKPVAVDLVIPSLPDLISEILLDPDLNDHEVSFYKKAWDFIPPSQIKKCNLYSRKDYQLKLGT